MVTTMFYAAIPQQCLFYANDSKVSNFVSKNKADVGFCFTIYKLGFSSSNSDQ